MFLSNLSLNIFLWWAVLIFLTCNSSLKVHCWVIKFVPLPTIDNFDADIFAVCWKFKGKRNLVWRQQFSFYTLLIDWIMIENILFVKQMDLHWHDLLTCHLVVEVRLLIVWVKLVLLDDCIKLHVIKFDETFNISIWSQCICDDWSKIFRVHLSVNIINSIGHKYAIIAHFLNPFQFSPLIWHWWRWLWITFSFGFLSILTTRIFRSRSLFVSRWS